MKRWMTIIVAAMCMALTATSCKDDKKESLPFPLFSTWLDYRPEMDFEAVCRTMQDAGIDGLMLNCPTPDDYRVAIPIAHKYGIRVYAWLWTVNLEHDRARLLAEHPEWFSVNRLGRSLADTTAYVNHYKFLCPAIPEVREYLNDKVKTYCEIDGLEGIVIDYHRYVVVVLPTTLWSKYGVVQDKEYPEWDFCYHPAMIEKFREQYGYSPLEEEDPTVDERWRQFRCAQITELANMFAETVHSYGKVMSASPFPTPKMASRMVGQEWNKWDLDIVFPMAYSNFYTLDPAFVYDCMVENQRDNRPGTVLGCGVMYWDGLIDSMREAVRGGAKAISIFTVLGLDTQEQVAEFRHFTDSVRAVAAANGGVLPDVKVPSAADTDPFGHPGILAQVELRIRELLAGITPESKWHPELAPAGPVTLPEVRLGEYAYLGENGVVRDYSVTDAVSGKTFKVSFYLFGDVLSGYLVEEMKEL